MSAFGSSPLKILFDQGTPVPLRKELGEHQVATAFEMGWARLSNGALLAEAEAKFDVLVTTDRRMRFQQNLAGRRLAILVLPTTSWPLLRRRSREIAAALSTLIPGEMKEIPLRDD